MPVPVPSAHEQAEVLREAHSVTGLLERTLDKLAEQSRLLRERRQALITAAVTGEVEV